MSVLEVLRDPIAQTPILQMGQMGGCLRTLSSIILAIIGKDLQRSGNNCRNPVVLSTYYLLFCTKNSICMISFTLQKNPSWEGLFLILTLLMGQ